MIEGRGEFGKRAALICPNCDGSRAWPRWEAVRQS